MSNFLHQFRAVEYLLVAVGPTQPYQVVVQSFGIVAHVPVGRDRGGAVALAEPFLVLAQDQRHVSEHRRFRAQGFVELHLPRRVGEVVVAPDDVGDAHVDVVAHHAEVVGGAPVRAGKDQVVQLRVVELHPALDLVVHHRGAAPRRAEADGVGHAFGQRHRSPFRRPARAVVHRLALLGQRRRALGLQGFRSAHAGVGVPRAQERADTVPIERHPLGLVERPLVPLQLQPLHALENGRDGLRRGPLAVRVLNAQDKLPAAVPRVQVVEQRRARAADVQVAGGAGSETCSDLGHGIGGLGQSLGVAHWAVPVMGLQPRRREFICYWRTRAMSNRAWQSVPAGPGAREPPHLKI